MKAFCGWILIMLCQEEIVLGILSSQRMESNLMACEFHVGADEAEWHHNELSLNVCPRTLCDH